MSDEGIEDSDDLGEDGAIGEMDDVDDVDDAEGGTALVLDVGDPPSGTPYAEIEDWRAEALMRANGIALSEAALVDTLRGGNSVLRAAAAHVLGAQAATGAADDLLEVARAADDLLKAEAAYALTRIGVEEGRAQLEACLGLPVQAYLGGPTAAGFLARLGDPSGFAVVQEALRQANLIVRVVAAKQLIYFVPYADDGDPDGRALDVYGEFERALDDDHEDVAWLAVLQLREVKDGRAEALLDRVRQTAKSDRLRRAASPSGD